MRKTILITLLILGISTFAQQEKFYYMGSTITEVIAIEGEPISVTIMTGTTQMLYFKAGSVIFKNGIVQSYRNSYNKKLKVKYQNPVKTHDMIIKEVIAEYYNPLATIVRDSKPSNSSRCGHICKECENEKKQ